MARLLKYFFRGLVVLAPLVLTVWLTFELFRRVDRWLGGTRLLGLDGVWRWDAAGGRVVRR